MKRSAITLGESLFLLIAGLFLGTIFTLSPLYWSARVEVSECPVVETSFSSVRVFYQRGHLQDAAIDCTDGVRYFTDAAATRESLTEALSRLEPGTPLTLRLHPNSHHLLEILADGQELLSFDWAMDRVERNGKGFWILALFLYAAAAGGALQLYRRKHYG